MLWHEYKCCVSFQILKKRGGHIFYFGRQATARHCSTLGRRQKPAISSIFPCMLTNSFSGRNPAQGFLGARVTEAFRRG